MTLISSVQSPIVIDNEQVLNLRYKVTHVRTMKWCFFSGAHVLIFYFKRVVTSTYIFNRQCHSDFFLSSLAMRFFTLLVVKYGYTAKGLFIYVFFASCLSSNVFASQLNSEVHFFLLSVSIQQVRCGKNNMVQSVVVGHNVRLLN